MSVLFLDFLSLSLSLYPSTLDILLKHSITFTFFQSLSLYLFTFFRSILYHTTTVTFIFSSYLSFPISLFLSLALFIFLKYIKVYLRYIFSFYFYLSTFGILLKHPIFPVPVSTFTIIPPLSLSLLLSWQTIKSANGKKF